MCSIHINWLKRGQLGGITKRQNDKMLKLHSYENACLICSFIDTHRDSLSHIDWLKDIVTMLIRKRVYCTLSFKWHLILMHLANFDNISHWRKRDLTFPNTKPCMEMSPGVFHEIKQNEIYVDKHHRIFFFSWISSYTGSC